MPTGDSDAAVADALGMETLAVGVLEGVDDGALERLGALVGRADAVVVADVDLTAGLAPVLSAVADSETPAYCIEERPTNERTVAEAAATAYRRLRVGEAGVAASTPELLDVLA
ncbi:hypothetical protein SY89_01656 [Halolamina pelagica]|uniref:Uncharacterized protein n=1 Tax=Halolamina pelagica TaxID=699431 RepID=A0A0N8HZZ9_9EURY|nr:hypothetical protein [Halolamina pelagica]KPN30915.1 hypothetical protein SY89_01656 [Halolamina pelagica]